MTRKQLFALVATVVGSAVVILDGTVVNLALPNIAHQFHASFADLQWVVDGYLLTLSALLLLGGSLGDIFGRKRVYMVGLAGFGLTSLLCGLSPNVTSLIALRLLQGVFGALLVPGALAIINTNFEKNMRAGAIGKWSAWSALAAPLGPLLGGYLIGVSSWRWIFFINVPLVVVCLLLARPGVTETKDDRVRRLDTSAAGLTALALGGITYGLIEGPTRHWHISAWLPLALGVLAFVVLLRVEVRQKDPMVRLDLFASRNFTGANVATFLLYGALGGFIFTVVIFLQTKAGFTPIQAGASMLPVALFLFTLSSKMGALAGKYGPRLFMTIGPLVVGTGMALLYHLHHGSSYWTGVLPGIGLFALGMAITVAPLTTTVMHSVEDADSGIASGINNAVSRIAGLLVVAVLGLLGSAHVYSFAIVLCSAMAYAAGVISFVCIQNAPRR